MSKRGRFLVGLGAGALLGILFAPKKGEDTRKDIKNMSIELWDKLKQVDPEELKEAIIEKVNELQRELKDLDREKVKEIAVEKAIEIRDKADALAKIAVEKSTPAIQKTTSELKKKAVEVLKTLTAKLEEEPKAKKTTKKAKK